MPLYAVDIHCFNNHAGLLVTHVYGHYTLEQSKFKKDFLMNQKSMQKVALSLERDFQIT